MTEDRWVYLIRRAIENEFGISEAGSDYWQGQALERMIRIVRDNARRKAVIEGERQIDEGQDTIIGLRTSLLVLDREKKEAFVEGFASGWAKMNLIARCCIGKIAGELEGRSHGLGSELAKRGGPAVVED